jgi:hypothetical protein
VIWLTGVPQRVTTNDVRDSHSRVMIRLRASMNELKCDDIDEWELEVSSDNQLCAELRSTGEHANRALATLSHPPSKVDYDTAVCTTCPYLVAVVCQSVSSECVMLVIICCNRDSVAIIINY